MKKKRVFGVVIALLLLIQVFRIDKSNPNAAPEKDFIAMTNPPPGVASLLKTACYDCHSDLTTYPWYTNIAPVSWWIKRHINEGRKHLNFSLWGDYNAKKASHKMEECYELVSEGEMPLSSYVWVHAEAALNTEQRKALTDFFLRTGGLDNGIPHDDEEDQD
ncbi:MAG: heme-binding domain-containing protein [Flavobacteriales bacterium]|nr:heme-binding domain-containing protein [Flavobacteriales bacterium]MCB9449532.1 heme-binding domain-containing protein [Flavobacteriales bacterium]